MNQHPPKTDASTRPRGPSPVVWVILAVAFGLRLAAVLWLSDTVPVSDFLYYHEAARKIVEDWTFFFDPQATADYARFGWWPPFYPFFVATLYTIFGVQHRVVVFLQVVLGTLVCWLVYRIGRNVAGERVGRVAAFLAAVNPTYVFATNLLASENLFVLWLSLGLLFATRFGVASSRRQQVLCGVSLGLATLTRAIGLLVPAVVAGWLQGRYATRRAWLVACAWLLGASAATIAPWTVRNAVVVGSPAIVCFGGGLNFYFGHNDTFIGYRDLSVTPMSRLRDQAAIDRTGYRLGFQYIAKHPWKALSRSVGKVRALFGSASYAPHLNSAIRLPENWQTNPVSAQIAGEMRARQRAKNRYLDGLFTWLANCNTALLSVGALVSSTVLWGRIPPGLRLMVFLCLYWIASHALFWGQARFRYPMELFLALLCAFSLVFAVSRRGVGGNHGVVSRTAQTKGAT